MSRVSQSQADGLSYCYADGITPISHDSWARQAAVYQHTCPGARSIRIASSVVNPKIVGNYVASVGPRGVHISERRWSYQKSVQSFVGTLLTESWSPTVSGVWAIAATARTGGWRLTLFDGITSFHASHLHALDMYSCCIYKWSGQAKQGRPDRKKRSHD